MKKHRKTRRNGCDFDASSLRGHRRQFKVMVRRRGASQGRPVRGSQMGFGWKSGVVRGTFQGCWTPGGDGTLPRNTNLEVTMKMVKSLLLASAAGLAAVGGAQAADLPVKAAPVEYVKVCSLYGEGFFYIPGTDTCLKIGGWVRVESYVGAGGSHAIYTSGATARNDRTDSPDFQQRARTVISADARTQTE